MIELPVPEGWLENVGFTRGNPFSIKEADTDPFLEPCFREKTYFDDICGDINHPRTAFLVAERGCGKSTNRRILARQCLEGKLGGVVLAVPYLEFGLLVDKASAPQETIPITARIHVNEILKHAVYALLGLLKERPGGIKQLYPEGHRMLFKWFLVHFSNVLSPYGMDNWLQQVGLLSKDINSKKLFEAAKKCVPNSSFTDFAGPSSAIIELLVDLINQLSLDLNAAEISHVDLLKHFVQLVDWLGIKAVYILVDRIDESLEIAADPQKGAELIEPLVADLHLMEMPKTAFKFFIPSNVADALKQKPTVRLDRLLFREIHWSDEDLVDLLERRIYVYSEGLLPNLEQLSVPELSGLTRSLVKHAHQSPRNLLRLGEWLIYHHVRLSGIEGRLINEDDLRAALASFREEMNSEQDQVQEPVTETEYEIVTNGETIAFEQGQVQKPVAETPDIPSELFVDKSGRVWRSREVLDVTLSQLEYRLLTYLCKNPGRLLTRDELIMAVYGEDEAQEINDQAFYRLMGRLREKVEIDSGNPQYIITMRSLGYRFEPYGNQG